VNGALPSSLLYRFFPGHHAPPDRRTEYAGAIIAKEVATIVTTAVKAPANKHLI
jgi:hypothetical protein